MTFPSHVFKRPTVGPTVFRDGSKVLSGFILSEKPVIEERWFKLPDIPAGWQPDPQRVWEANKENIPKREINREPMPYSKWKSSGMTAGEVRIIIILLGNVTDFVIARRDARGDTTTSWPPFCVRLFVRKGS
jgi:hypothetical protein